MFDEKAVNLERMIYEFRGFKVMLDSDLADLYGIETKVLNQQVKRNLKRFPSDFMFQLNEQEAEHLQSRKYLPYVFTENGVAMLSGVLNSDPAISVNISIMRTFTKLRSFLALESTNAQKIDELGKSTNHLFKIVFERLDDIDSSPTKPTPVPRKRIGLNNQGS
jgi:hypothetical protein